MKNKDEQLELIIVRFLHDELDETEKASLNEWLQESNENRLLFNEIKKTWEAVSMLEKMKKIDEEKAFHKLSRQLFRDRRQAIWKTLQKVAAVLFIPLLIVSVFYYVNGISKLRQLSSVYQTIETPPGMRSSLVLADGTKVWLNSGSTIRYPLYPGNERYVEMKGEVFFEVKKDKSRPFIVNAGDVSIEVTGTSFNCRAYADDRVISTVLVEGSVKISHPGSDEMLMKAGELVEYSKADHRMVRYVTDPEKYIAWKSGKLMFRDDPMDVVIQSLERWYNVEIKVVDKEILQYAYTATFENETLEQVLHFLKLSAPIRYSVDERERRPDGTFGRQTIKLYKK